MDNRDAAASADEGVLFRSLHACGHALQRNREGRGLRGFDDASLTRLHASLQEHLVNRNIGLIYEMKRRSRVTSLDGDDLFSEGLWTMFRAVASFDPWKGFRFSTYACRSILRAFLLMARRRRRRIDHLNGLWEEETAALDIDRHRQQPSRDLDRQLLIDRLHFVLDNNTASLTPAERFVLERRVLNTENGQPETLESIGRAFRLSKERVRQIQLTALRKLEAVLTGPRANVA